MRAIGRLNKGKEGALARTFRHIGAIEPWSWGFALFVFYVLSVTSFLTDAVRLNNFTWLWLIVSGSGFIPPIAIGIIYRTLVLKKDPSRNRPILNLIVAGIAGSSRNVSVGIFAAITGLDYSDLWSFRFLGGFFAGVAIYVFWAITQGARIEYETSIRTLEGLQQRLLANRKELPDLLDGMTDQLKARARSSVLLQLDQINKAISQRKDLGTTVEHLRRTLSGEIRPILKELQESAPKPFIERDISDFVRNKANLPKRFRLKSSLLALPSALTTSLVYDMWLIFLLGTKGLLQAATATAIYGTTFWTLKQLIPKTLEVTKTIATLATLAISLIASGVSILYFATIALSPAMKIPLIGVLVFSGVVAPWLLSRWQVRFNLRRELEAQIEIELQKISKENAIYSQRLWVFQKQWLLLLHGTVQSALTAAINRLERSEEIDEVTIQLVKQDLVRAERAITGEVQSEIDNFQALEELKNVWSGVCNVHSVISERAKRALSRNPDLAFCVNEIAKEATSNAVRHGLAKNVFFEIDRIEDEELLLSISNDGIPPPENANSGIGSQMLDDVTTDWSLTSKGKKVLLEAALPFRF